METQRWECSRFHHRLLCIYILSFWRHHKSRCLWVFYFCKKIFLTEKKGLKLKVQELETDKTSAILTVFRDCDWLLIPNGWAAVQGPPEIKETHGKISLGTHYCKKENVKARPKKVEQETRTGNVKTQRREVYRLQYCPGGEGIMELLQWRAHFSSCLINWRTKRRALNQREFPSPS